MNKPSRRKPAKAPRRKGPGVLTMFLVGLVRGARRVRDEARALSDKPAARKPERKPAQKPRHSGPQGPSQRHPQRSGGQATPGRQHPRTAAEERSRDVWGDKGNDRWPDGEQRPRSGGRGSEDSAERPNADEWAQDARDQDRNPDDLPNADDWAQDEKDRADDGQPSDGDW